MKMPTNVLNPSYEPYMELVADESTWTTLKAVVQTYLDDNNDLSTVNIATVRALDGQLANDAIWAQITMDMGLDAID